MRRERADAAPSARRAISAKRVSFILLALWTFGGGVAVAAESADQKIGLAMFHESLAVEYAFSGDTFPRVDFKHPERVAGLIGPYEIHTRFFDRNYSEVTVPNGYGRFGVVATFTARKTGQSYTRLATLYRHRENADWDARQLGATIGLPDAFALDPAVVFEQQATLGHYLMRQFRQSVRTDPDAGALLAGLFESVPGEGAHHATNSVWTRDRTWWIGLRRLLDRRPVPDALETPRAVLRGRATELTFGSPEEAGMSSGADAAVDAACQNWLDSTGDPFAVCVARKGVVFFYRSYGDVGGKPMTLATPGPMMSIVKVVSGTLLSMLSDIKRIDVDAPLAAYLPAFERDGVSTALTTRHLYTHTSGLQGHWGEKDRSLDYRVAEMGSDLAVGEAFRYSSTDYALAGVLLETVTGKAFPALADALLLGPLGMADTQVPGAIWGMESTPLDMARLGQMLLNRGAYGDFRFFEPELYDAMLPRPLTGILGEHADTTWGLGVSAFPNEGMSEQTFGHGASSGAIFRVDPENELVVVMARFGPGLNYEVHKSAFLKAIAEGVAREDGEKRRKK